MPTSSDVWATMTVVLLIAVVVGLLADPTAAFSVSSEGRPQYRHVFRRSSRFVHRQQEIRYNFGRSSMMRQLFESNQDVSDGMDETPKKLPKLIVFDLDGCLWRPEMYELLWDGQGAPFEPIASSRDADFTKLQSKGGTVVELIGDVADVLDELYLDSKWSDVQIGISSRTDEPNWARELLRKFVLPQSKVSLDAVVTGPWEIAHDSKTAHFDRLAQSTTFDLEDMLFFDNEAGNCRMVSRKGVSVCYCPNGVTRSAFDEAIANFPCSRGQVVGIHL